MKKWKKRNKVILSMKDLIFKERLVKKLTERYMEFYMMEEIVSRNIVKLKLPVSMRIHSVKIVDGGLYFIFSFHFYFTLLFFSFSFLFLEQLRLGFISHAVTSVTN